MASDTVICRGRRRRLSFFLSFFLVVLRFTIYENWNGIEYSFFKGLHDRISMAICQVESAYNIVLLL